MGCASSIPVEHDSNGTVVPSYASRVQHHIEHRAYTANREARQAYRRRGGW
jgi:hypothetical protein